MPVWLVDLMATSPYVAASVTVVWLLIRHWCLLLAGTIAVLHPDERRRADARELVRLLRADGRGPAELDDGPPGGPPGGPPAPPRRRRRR